MTTGTYEYSADWPGDDAGKPYPPRAVARLREIQGERMGKARAARYLPNMGGLDYNGPFYRDSTPREVREERRAMVPHYVPHTFAEYPKGDVRRGLCRICAFPGSDAACAVEQRAAGWPERMTNA